MAQLQAPRGEEEDWLVVDAATRAIIIPKSFKNIALCELREKAKQELCLHLNVKNGPYGDDWRLIADEIGLRSVEIDNMERRQDPMKSVIQEAIQRNFSLHGFLQIIAETGRIDVLHECQDYINQSVERYRKTTQVPEVTSSWTPLTKGDLETGEKEYFDAFVSCDLQDGNFVTELMEKLEKEYGFKLCIRERDLIPGLMENQAVAELIEKSYTHSPRNMLRWQLGFAAAIAATEQINKLVPVLIESDYEIPPILRPFHIPDFTNAPFRSWFWDRVVTTLESDLKGNTGYQGPPGPLGRKQVTGRVARSNTDPVMYSSRDSGMSQGSDISEPKQWNGQPNQWKSRTLSLEEPSTSAPSTSAPSTSTSRGNKFTRIFNSKSSKR